MSDITAGSAESTPVAFGPAVYLPGSGEPQSILAASAIEGPVAHGALVTRVGDVAPRLQATLYHRNDLTTPLSDLPNAWGRGWQEILNELGSGELTLGNEDPDVMLVPPDAVVRFTDDGWAAFCMLVNDLDHQQIAEGEEHDQVTKLTGVGHIAILQEAVVWPSRGVTSRPIQTERGFNWTSTDYNHSWWSYATGIAAVADETPAWYGMREGWPAGSPAWWIGPSMGTVTLAPGGTNYFRREFTVPDLFGGLGYDVMIYLVADDTADLYLDGQSMMTTGQWGNTPSDIYTTPATVTPGPHTLAVSVNNSEDGPAIIDGEPFNPTGFVLTVHPLNPDGTPQPTPIVVSDASWRIVEYPPGPPGMTPGEVIRHVIQEAQQRAVPYGVLGPINEITFNFTDEVDSAGKPWPITTDIATKVGYDLWTFFKELAATYIDIWMEPASFRLWAWNKGGRGQYRDVPLHAPTDPNDPSTGNIVNLKYHVVQ